MKKLLSLLLVCLPFLVPAQTYTQYFDGADTFYSSVIVRIDTDSSNIWQIGPPQKHFFDSAATLPNAIVTDTIGFYPINNVSSFVISTYSPTWGGTFIRAYRWKQKLDLDKKHDGAIVEFSIDSGTTWENAFNNPHVYNYYGYEAANKDTLLTGEYAFSGTDSAWRDVWLCFDPFSTATTDSLLLRFTIRTDSIDSNREGWLIDNFRVQRTYIHTATKIEGLQLLKVFPTLTSGLVQIQSKETKQPFVIENVQLVNEKGQVVATYGKQDKQCTIDISGQPPGMYLLKVTTNIEMATYRITLQK